LPELESDTGACKFDTTEIQAEGSAVRMQKWILVAETDCSDPSREREFNQWYDTVHAPDVLETPGILRATRFKNDEPPEGHGKYFAIYEVETEDIRQLSKTFGEIMTSKWEQGRMSELVAPVHATFYQQMAPPIEPSTA
jgi:hypothetical protein